MSATARSATAGTIVRKVLASATPALPSIQEARPGRMRYLFRWEGLRPPPDGFSNKADRKSLSAAPRADRARRQRSATTGISRATGGVDEPFRRDTVAERAAGDSGALGRRLAARLRGVRQTIHPYAGDRAGRVRPIPIAAISRRGGFLRKPAVARGTLSWKLPNPVDRRRERLTLRRPRMAPLSRPPGQGSTVSPDLPQACAQPVGASRPSAVSRTACSSARNGGRSSAERRATNPER